MKRLFLVLCWAALCAAAPAGFAATDLVAAWQAARQHDAEFAAAEAQWRAGETKKRQGLALLLPSVQAQGGVGRSTMRSNTSGAQFFAPGFGQSEGVDFATNINGGDTSNWAVSARQPLYDAERFAGFRQLRRQAELATLKYHLAEQQLMLRVAQVYFDYVRSEHSLKTLRALKTAVAQARDEAAARFKAGDAPVTDRDDAQARFDMIAAQEIAAASDLEQKRSAFVAVTGLEPVDLAPLGQGIVIEPGTLTQWQQRAAADNLLIAMRSAGVDIARAEADKFRLLTSPKLDLVAQVGETRFDGSGDFGSSYINTSGWSVGLQLTVPIFTGGMRSARHDEAVAQSEASQFDLDAVRTLVRRQAETAWLGVSAGAARVTALEQAQRSADRRLQSTRVGHRVGARTTLDELNAEADDYNARNALIDARCNLLLSRLQLDAVAGALDETRLQQVNNALQITTRAQAAPQPVSSSRQ